MAQGQQSLPEGPTPQNNAPQALPSAPNPQQNTPQQSLPEAPSASKPNPQLPSQIPSTPPPNAQETTVPPPNNPAPGSPADVETPSGTSPGTEPSSQIKTVPPGSVPAVPGGSRDRLYTLTKEVNFVQVPVRVKDDSGHLVEGLVEKNFSVYEDGVKQPIKFFTSDPFPLTAALVLDTGLPSNVYDKVRDTIPALVGAFGQFDDIAFYTYGNTVKQWSDFTLATSIPDAVLRRIKAVKGSAPGAPVVGGPLGQSGPTINGRPLDPSQPSIPIYNPNQVESHVLNDAILRAALDLETREPTRRKVIFIISDGREMGSTAGYAEVMKVLLSNNISLYAVGVGGAAIPGYRTLQRIHIPGMGYGDILPKYASATGGDVFSEFDRSAIETAYSRATLEARNQYTLGYTTRATPSSAYRTIEVVVDRPNLRVYAKDGYYPLPPRRE